MCRCSRRLAIPLFLLLLLPLVLSARAPAVRAPAPAAGPGLAAERAGMARPAQAGPTGFRPAAGGDSGARVEPLTSEWPVPGVDGGARPTVTRGFTPPATPWAAGHRGVDLAAPPGATVRAVAEGRVAFAGPVGGRGVVTVELAGTGEPPLRLTHEPVRPLVREGERVSAGQPLGTLTSGAASHCGLACLHWGLLRGTAYQDPLALLPERLLRHGPARLLPTLGVPEPTTGQTTGQTTG